jgi:hypothetical protein
VSLWVDGFGAFAQFMLCVMACQVRKSYTSAEVHWIDVEMLPFDLLPSAALVGKVFDQSNRNLILNSFSVRLANCAKEQHPSFTPAAVLFLQPASLMSLRHKGLPGENEMPNETNDADADGRAGLGKLDSLG